MVRAERYGELLRAAGYRRTPGRLALLAALDRATRPVSAAWLRKQLGDAFDAVTLYRALNAFVLRGLVRRVDFEHDHAHYELADRPEHHHIVCVQCGAVEDVTTCPVTSIEPAVLRGSKRFVRLERHALEFFGTCRACAKRA